MLHFGNMAGKNHGFSLRMILVAHVLRCLQTQVLLQPLAIKVWSKHGERGNLG